MRSRKKSQPGCSCYILYDKLYIDNKMYTWDAAIGKVGHYNLHRIVVESCSY